MFSTCFSSQVSVSLFLFCFHYCYYFRLLDHITPEILRTPLHELALAIKLLQFGELEQFLAKAMEQSSKQSITEALVTLQGSNTIHSLTSITCYFTILISAGTMYCLPKHITW